MAARYENLAVPLASIFQLTINFPYVILFDQHVMHITCPVVKCESIKIILFSLNSRCSHFVSEIIEILGKTKEAVSLGTSN